MTNKEVVSRAAMTMSANVLSSLLLVARLSWKWGVKAVVVSVYWSKSDADLCQEGYGFISFSLLAGLPKKCSSNNHKLCEKVAHGPRKKPLHVGGNPDHVMGTSHAPQTWPHFRNWSCDQFRNFGTPFYIFGMTKGRNFIFGAHIDYDMYYPMHNKLTPKEGVVRVTWPKFKISGSSITFERIKLCVPNFVW